MAVREMGYFVFISFLLASLDFNPSRTERHLTAASPSQDSSEPLVGIRHGDVCL